MKKGKKLTMLIMASVLALTACGNDNISNTEEESHEEESYVSDSYESESYETESDMTISDSENTDEAAPQEERVMVDPSLITYASSYSFDRLTYDGME